MAADTPKINLEEGLWRINVEMDIPGKGQQTGPLRADMCLRPDDVAKRLTVPDNSPCTVYGLEITPRRMRWKVACEQGQMRSAGEGIMEFGGNELSSALLIKTAAPYAMTIKQSIVGKRIGPCPPGAGPGPVPLKRYGQ
jgi:hypothetical protein